MPAEQLFVHRFTGQIVRKLFELNGEVYYIDANGRNSLPSKEWARVFSAVKGDVRP